MSPPWQRVAGDSDGSPAFSPDEERASRLHLPGLREDRGRWLAVRGASVCALAATGAESIAPRSRLRLGVGPTTRRRAGCRAAEVRAVLDRMQRAAMDQIEEQLQAAVVVG